MGSQKKSPNALSVRQKAWIIVRAAGIGALRSEVSYLRSLLILLASLPMAMLEFIPPSSAGKLLERVGNQAVEAQKYLTRYSHLGGESGLFMKIINPASQTAVDSAGNVLSQLQRVGWRSNTGLRSAAAYYRKTEHRAAAKADAAYPKVARPAQQHGVDLARPRCRRTTSRIKRIR